MTWFKYPYLVIDITWGSFFAYIAQAYVFVYYGALFASHYAALWGTSDKGPTCFNFANGAYL